MQLLFIESSFKHNAEIQKDYFGMTDDDKANVSYLRTSSKLLMEINCSRILRGSEYL